MVKQLTGGEGRNRLKPTAIAGVKWLISLVNQRKSAEPNYTLFNSFGVRFGVR